MLLIYIYTQALVVYIASVNPTKLDPPGETLKNTKYFSTLSVKSEKYLSVFKKNT
jgi:hypothetical protein